MKHALATALVLVLAHGCGGVVAPCNLDEDCRADAVCLEGVCALRAPPAPPQPCPDGTHDGGDGACVALDVCSDGFTLLFRDGDGDGTGIGERVDCGPLPPPLGLADDAGDCDDDDPAGFTITESFADADNDGFTRRVSLCGNGAPPPGAPLVARPAPVLAAHPADLRIAFNDDTGATVQVRLFGPALGNSADSVGLRCPTLPATVTGVVVHARVKLATTSIAEASVIVTASAQFIDGDARSEERFAATAPVVAGDITDLVFGGAEDAFGVDANALCDDSLRITFLSVGRADQGNIVVDNATLLVDAVWLELFADAEDCDDGDANVYSPATLFDDSDGDGQGGGNGEPACIGSNLPSAALAALDCDDSDGRVHLGQTEFFPIESAGGVFDYDCNGVLEPGSVDAVVDCFFDPNAGSCIPVTGVAAPAECGALVDTGGCNPQCSLTGAGNDIEQPCR